MVTSIGSGVLRVKSGLGLADICSGVLSLPKKKKKPKLDNRNIVFIFLVMKFGTTIKELKFHGTFL